MIDASPFLNADWFWIVVVFSSIGIALFLWKEWTSPQHQGRFLRSSLGVLAIACLAAIALKPTVEVAATRSGVVLITEDARTSQIDSLFAADPGLEMIHYKKGINMIPEGVYPEIAYVLGNGIAPFDLWQLESIPTTYLGSESPVGLIHLDYPEQSSVGEILELNILFKSTVPNHQLVLEGPDGVGIDSLSLSADASQQLQLMAPLKLAGNFLYQLVEKNVDGKVVQTEPIPISIAPKRQLSITIVNTFPSFETKYIKNFLAEEGHQLIVRSQVTRGRFKYEYFNTQNNAQHVFSDASLAATDLLIMDVGALRQLSSAQRATIRKNIQEEGLGLLVQPDVGLLGITNALFPIELTRQSNSVVTLDELSEKQLNRYALAFIDSPWLVPIHLTADSTLISGFRRNGKGVIGTTLLQNTYELQLRGQQETYEKIWTEVVNGISKEMVPISEWTTESIIGFPHQPFYFTLRTAIENPVVTNENDSQIPLQQDPYLPQNWEGIVYPTQIGWDELKIDNDTINHLPIYVADTIHWTGISTTQTINANAQSFSEEIIPAPIMVRVPINRLWFFIPFLLCMGYLWFEPKWKG